MGNRVSDKRRFRREHRDEFVHVIGELNARMSGGSASKEPTTVPAGAGGHEGSATSGRSADAAREGAKRTAAASSVTGAAAATVERRKSASRTGHSSKTRVLVRKRPIFAHETKKDEFDVVHVTRAGNEVCVHDCRPHNDMKSLFLESVSFGFDRVFHEGEDNDTVVNEVAAPLIRHVLSGRSGGSTVFAYGQTGSGKTYTVSALQEGMASMLFHEKPASLVATVTCFEMCGSHCFDLLNDRREVHLREAADGTTHVRGARIVPVGDPTELLRQVDWAAANRKTEATAVNDQSSRSHSVTRVRLWTEAPAVDIDLEDEGGMPDQFSELCIIDLAGSERNIDSASHDAEQRRQGAEINTSLMALKNCIRAKAAREASASADPGSLRIPYRSSTLTRLLKHVFVDDSAYCVLLATVSPSSKDTEHSINTLRHARLMGEGVDSEKSRVRVEVPTKLQRAMAAAACAPVSKWSSKDAQQWAATETRRLAKLASASEDVTTWVLPASVDGKQLMRWAKPRYVALCGGNERAGEALMKRFKEVVQQDKAKAKARRDQIRAASRHGAD